ncbi:OLC1v1026322C2 [Oldenlandia corymbosa var. corymbosa]|uniref:non-specific serine/threonine protein kinase n=1 Tax=Oldenlandia corymbosa var. corymbosa TaxID=529605 RepID=A0AAV1C930_OLDCO|nr:OLC1v1026322C2 [Oldenlandia corymbosa var. corymbosa]
MTDSSQSMQSSPAENAAGNDQDTWSFDSRTSTSSTTSNMNNNNNMVNNYQAKDSNVPSFNKPHSTANSSPGWDAIRSVLSYSATNMITLQDLSFIQKLGSGDIGTVYLVELKGAKGITFAAKVMDKEELAIRSKEARARLEREILEVLDHPFLPTLYTTLESDRWSCLLTEFCPGGDLHILRQRQPYRRFDEAAVRFYTSEVVAALEYLHMKGIIYRDLKPENILVRSDGHIMLTDFDLSLRCDESKPKAQLLSNDSLSSLTTHQASSYSPDVACPVSKSHCMLPSCMVPDVSCFRTTKQRMRRPGHHEWRTLEIVAEPIEARSLSFVGTHEYLAPEVVSGEGHGSAVDWWTLGIFMYELFYGLTPFRGLDNEFTLSNIVARGLEFPKEPAVSNSAKDLITKLLIKNPAKRLGSTIGATAIKNHSFFDGVNWALLRCTLPPHIPQPTRDLGSSQHHYDASVEYY